MAESCMPVFVVQAGSLPPTSVMIGGQQAGPAASDPPLTNATGIVYSPSY